MGVETALLAGSLALGGVSHLQQRKAQKRAQRAADNSLREKEEALASEKAKTAATITAASGSGRNKLRRGFLGSNLPNTLGGG